MFFDMRPGGQFGGLNLITAAKLVSSFVIILMIGTSILFIFTLIMGGVRWILSGGNRELVDRAKGQMANAFVGLLIIFSAWAILNLVSVFFGVDLLVFKIPTANL